MSLLNMANDGMPNVLLAVYRYLLSEGPTAEAKVLGVCAPPAVCNPNRARGTLNTWAKLGLFDRGDDDKVRLVKQSPAAKDEAHLRGVVRALVLHPDNNDPFWGQEGVKAADFTRGLAWCLAMDPWRLHGQGYAPVERLELDTLPADREIFRNDTRWNGFKAWAPFLGFGWLAGFPKKGTLVIDPTPAVRDELPGVFAGAGELTQNVFLERLRDRLPVLDGGTYRRDVEQAIDRRAWTPPPAGAVSASLSLALVRLKNEGRIDFADRADAPTGRVQLVGRGGKQLAAVTHVLNPGGRA